MGLFARMHEMYSEPTPERSRGSRDAAERALVRIVRHYGGRPEFVLIGGLVPELLCSNSEFLHAGTLDVDVQVNPEIASGAVNAVRLERALLNAGLLPEPTRKWRWGTSRSLVEPVIKFDLLADLQNQPAGSTIEFDKCRSLGAVNLRGTGFASSDFEMHRIRADIDGIIEYVEVNVASLSGFFLAKVAAAFSRRSSKDWYDIAFVLLHNNFGGPEASAKLVKDRFADRVNALRTALLDLRANFADPHAQGSQAYVQQMLRLYSTLDATDLATQAVLAVEVFYRELEQSFRP